MAFRFRKSIKLAPGFKLNVGKKSVGLSAGVKGARYSVNSSGRTTTSMGIPGTGLSYVNTSTSGSSPQNDASAPGLMSEEEVVNFAGKTAPRTPLELIDSLEPRESGLRLPSGCLLLLFWPIWIILALIRVTSKKYQAKRLILSAIKMSLQDQDAIKTAAAEAESSWTIQAYAGLYFQKMKSYSEAATYFNAAALLFQGDSRLLKLVSAECAQFDGQLDFALSLLEPYLLNANPGEDNWDALILAEVSNILNKKREFSKALEIANRLPLRKRDLDEVLLRGLSSRAEAKIGLRKLSDAQKDIDRIYATDPSFESLEELEALLAEARASQ